MGIAQGFLALVWLVCLASARDLLEPEAGYQLLVVSPLPEQQDSQHHDFDAQKDTLQWTDSAEDPELGPSLTLSLLHRDSPLSPFKDSQATPQDLLLQRLSRDAARVEALSSRASMAAKGIKPSDLITDPSSTKYAASKAAAAAGNFMGPVMSGLKQGSGEYFTRLGVGTPARETYMVVDTGSDVVWLQCTPCIDCYPQTDPVFNPLASSSFQRLSCAAPMCSMLELHGCEGRTHVCQYQIAYGDGSFTTGDFSLETLSFRGATMREVGIGCGHDNEGLFAGASGLFGLGGGSLSFPSQMGPQFNKIFSYCLVDRSNLQGASSLVFGKAAVPRRAAFTPLLRNPSLATFYYVSLAGISVGGQALGIPEAAFRMDASGDGGVIVDSGTSVTRLVEVAYGPLRSAFRNGARGLPFVGGFSLFDTCYNLSSRRFVSVPAIVLHFAGQADVALPASNYFIPVDTKGTYCLAFASTAGELSIIGNIQQQGFRVIFDGVNSRLGFAPNQC